jgi:hypothetical protein
MRFADEFRIGLGADFTGTWGGAAFDLIKQAKARSSAFSVRLTAQTLAKGPK